MSERLQLWAQALFRRALFVVTGLYFCDSCGVVIVKGGAPILLNHEDVCEHGAKERFGAYCERCWNPGLIAEDLKRVRKEFGRL